MRASIILAANALPAAYTAMLASGSVSAAPLRIAAVTRKPHSASFDHRIARYVPGLAALGIDVTCRVLPEGQLQQGRLLAALAEFDGVWWHRHLLAPWWIRRLRRSARRLLLDYDDPLPFSSRDGGRPSRTRRHRFAALLRRADAVLVASAYLRQLAEPYCRRAWVVPMAIDADAAPAAPPAEPDRGQPIELLWVGSRPTQPYLELIREPLEAIGRRLGHTVRLRLVGHEAMSFAPLEVDFRMWSPAAEAAALRECQIGLCPMPDTIWTRGKCPFKVLQYMSHGLPWVGSAVGENLVMAAAPHDEPRGLCAQGTSDWQHALERLVHDAALRRAMGSRGQQYVREHHDRGVLVRRVADIWRELVRSP